MLKTGLGRFFPDYGILRLGVFLKMLHFCVTDGDLIRPIHIEGEKTKRSSSFGIIPVRDGYNGK